MARVELAPVAVRDLERLIRALSRPEDTFSRVQRSLRALETFALIGPELPGDTR